jgi:hypothetical protein
VQGWLLGQRAVPKQVGHNSRFAIDLSDRRYLTPGIVSFETVQIICRRAAYIRDVTSHRVCGRHWIASENRGNNLAVLGVRLHKASWYPELRAAERGHAFTHALDRCEQGSVMGSSVNQSVEFTIANHVTFYVIALRRLEGGLMSGRQVRAFRRRHSNCRKPRAGRFEFAQHLKQLGKSALVWQADTCATPRI